MHARVHKYVRKYIPRNTQVPTGLHAIYRLTSLHECMHTGANKQANTHGASYNMHIQTHMYARVDTTFKQFPNNTRLNHYAKHTDHTTSHIHSTSLRRDSFSRTTPLTVMATVKSHANVITIGSMICMASVYLELEWNQCQRKRLK